MLATAQAVTMRITMSVFIVSCGTLRKAQGFGERVPGIVEQCHPTGLNTTGFVGPWLMPGIRIEGQRFRNQDGSGGMLNRTQFPASNACPLDRFYRNDIGGQDPQIHRIKRIAAADGRVGKRLGVVYFFLNKSPKPFVTLFTLLVVP